MLTHIKEATWWSLRLFGYISAAIGFGFSALWNWLYSFAVVSSTTKLIVPPLLIILVGALITPFPWWVLAFICVIPPRIAYPILLVSMIVMLKQ